jgi:hypothetical protein
VFVQSRRSGIPPKQRRKEGRRNGCFWSGAKTFLWILVFFPVAQEFGAKAMEADGASKAAEVG